MNSNQDRDIELVSKSTLEEVTKERNRLRDVEALNLENQKEITRLEKTLDRMKSRAEPLVTVLLTEFGYPDDAGTAVCEFVAQVLHEQRISLGTLRAQLAESEKKRDGLRKTVEITAPSCAALLSRAESAEAALAVAQEQSERAVQDFADELERGGYRLVFHACSTVPGSEVQEMRGEIGIPEYLRTRKEMEGKLRDAEAAEQLAAGRLQVLEEKAAEAWREWQRVENVEASHKGAVQQSDVAWAKCERLKKENKQLRNALASVSLVSQRYDSSSHVLVEYMGKIAHKGLAADGKDQP